MGQYSYPFMVFTLAVQNIGWQGVVADWHVLTWKGFGAAAFLAYFATIIGYGLWIYLLTRYPVAKISPLSLWVPVISMIFAFLFLDEQLNTLQWLGSCIVMLGLMVHLLGQKIQSYITSRKLVRTT